MERYFTIGDLALRAGVNLQTVRYYEKRRLLLPSARKESGYRLYGEEALRRLKFIRHAKELGFTLEEIRGLLDLRISDESAGACETVRARTEAKLSMVENKIAALESVRKVLVELLECCDKRLPTEACPILKAIEEIGFKKEA